MARTLTRPDDPGLYDEDFLIWTQRQAELLRAGRFAELDLPHLIEEVEDLGTSQRSDVFSRSQRILQHFLKLQLSPAVEPRRRGLQSVDDQRDDMELVITPSLRRELEQTLSERYARARRRAARDFARYGENTNLPADCPYTVEQILDPDWYPANVHGISDPMPEAS